MEKIPVFWNGKKLRDIYPHATRWEVIKWKIGKFFRKLFIGIGIVLFVVSVYLLGGRLNPAVVYTKAEVIKEVESDAPVLERIADCESGKRLPNGRSVKGSATHFDSNGQVLMRSNTNRSVDVGRYQINTVWFKKATEFGLDITLEKDNKEMATWIYKNRGTEDWYSSKSCWQ